MFDFSKESPHKDFSEYIVRMAYLAEVKEWDNRLHLERCRRYTGIIASALGLAAEDVEVLATASQLHDIGKATIPENLLMRTGEYTKDEWVLIERHPLEGAIILNGSQSPILNLAETIAMTHHERWDGSGYPEGLKGDKIPLPGRIMGLVDVFDAATTKRIYKDPISEKDGLRVVQQLSGKLFDPRVVNAFEQRFDEILESKNSADQMV
jgi:putative two-component system response regulator